MLILCRNGSIVLANRDMSNRDKIIRAGIGSTFMRNSNIELLRIVAMLAIIAHHYVVN